MCDRSRLASALLLITSLSWAAVAAGPDRRMVLTFDDLPAQRAPHLPEERIAAITGGLLATLGEHRIPAVGFVNEDKLEIGGAVDPGRVRLLERWVEAGLELGNHTYSHLDLHRVPVVEFERDVVRGEAVTRPLLTARGEELRWFRHPFLHSGRDLETKRKVEAFLAGRGYRVAPVTVDNSEWIFACAYDEALDRGDAALRDRLAAAYLDYMERMVVFYEGQSRELLGREIPQVLLLHANALNADHLDALVRSLVRRGYRFIALDEALEDPAYASPDTYTGPGGITWLHRWAITRGADRAGFRGEPTTPGWVEEAAGVRESPRGPPASPPGGGGR